MNLAAYASPLAGGLLIGLAAALLLLTDGRVAGISGVVGGLVEPSPDGVAWRAWFVGALLLGAIALRVLAPGVLGTGPSASLGTLGVAGALVGYGTRLSNG